MVLAVISCCFPSRYTNDALYSSPSSTVSDCSFFICSVLIQNHHFSSNSCFVPFVFLHHVRRPSRTASPLGRNIEEYINLINIISFLWASNPAREACQNCVLDIYSWAGRVAV